MYDNGNIQSSFNLLQRNAGNNASMSSRLFIDATVGNIGINSTNPLFNMDINGILKVGNSVASNYSASANIILTPLTGQGNTIEISFNNNAGLRNWIYTNSPGGMAIGGQGALQLQTGTSSGTVSTYATLTSGGNFGIGTTIPSEILHVNGNIKNTGYNYINSNTLTTGSAGTVLFATGNSGFYSGRFHINAVNSSISSHCSFTLDVSGCFTENGSIQSPTISVKRSQWSGGTSISNITICTAPSNGTYISTFFLTCATNTQLTITQLENENQGGGITLNTLALTTLTSGYSQLVYPLANTAILQGGMGNYLNVNSAGVGINTTGGSSKLHVFSSDIINTLFVENNGGGNSTQGALRVKVNATSAARNMLQLENATNITMIARDDGNIGINQTNPATALDVNGQLYFSNTGSINPPTQTTLGGTGAKITLYPGTASTNVPHAIGVQGANMWYSSYFGHIWYCTTTSPSMQLTNGNLLVTGNITAFSSISDERLKTSIKDISGDNALKIINDMRPVTFNWRDDLFNKTHAGQSDSGFIAQEIEKLIPHAVSEYTDITGGETETEQKNYKNLRHERIIPYIVSAMQELFEKSSQKQDFLEKSLQKQQELIQKLENDFEQKINELKLEIEILKTKP